jgi:hypothetical protein
MRLMILFTAVAPWAALVARNHQVHPRRGDAKISWITGNLWPSRASF